MNTALVSGLIILVLLVIMLLAGVPIAVALGISSVCAILPIMDTNVAVLTGAQRIFSGISVFSLLAIPFFILAGNIMNKGGIAVRLINLAKLITGRAPGALAQTNVIANMLFGAISGSGTAAASAMGEISRDDARNHPDKNIITRALGAGRDVDVDFFDVRLTPGDILLLCSDGLSNMVPDEDIRQVILTSETLEEAGRRLVSMANDNGGRDNIAVVLVEPETKEVEVC